MANLSNINNILRVSSSGVGINKNNTGPSELDIESAGADIIDMTRTNLKTYRFAISGASAFSLFDVAAGVDRLTIDSSGNSTFAGNVTVADDITTTGSSKSVKYFRRWYMDANNDFGINNNAGTSTLFYMNSSGKVGIGQTVPEAMLDISVGGADYGLEISTPERNRALFFYNSASTTDAGYLGIKRGSVDALNHRFATTGNSAVCIGEGNFGIGIDGASRKLDVRDASNTQATILAYNQGATFTGTVYEAITDRVASGAFNLMNLKSSTASKFLVRGDGNVGITQTAPMVHVHSGSAITAPNSRYLNFQSPEISLSGYINSFAASYDDDTAISIPKEFGIIMHNDSQTDNTFSPGIVFGNQSDSGLYSAANSMIAGRRLSYQGDTNWSAGELWFWTATGDTAPDGTTRGLPNTPVMVMDSFRNVGIGTTSPSAKLHVKSTANADVIFKLENTNTGTSAGAKIELIDDEGGSGSGAGGLRHSISSISQTVGNWIIGSGAAAGQLQFSTVDAFAMIINEEQNVGIGTTSPTYPLEVAQNTTNNFTHKIGNDSHSEYVVSGLQDHTVTLECPSYYNGKVIITASQTNGGTTNNIYLEGIWQNNHTSHIFTILHNIGSLSGSTLTTTVSAGPTSTSGRLVVFLDYGSGSFSNMVVRVCNYFSTHTGVIT